MTSGPLLGSFRMLKDPLDRELSVLLLDTLMSETLFKVQFSIDITVG